MVPRECEDGFMAAFWARPHAYLDPAARAATSPWHDLPAASLNRALIQLRKHLDGGEWQRRHGHLLAHTELDVGLRLITASSSSDHSSTTRSASLTSSRRRV
jgi:hypothetical protein